METTVVVFSPFQDTVAAIRAAADPDKYRLSIKPRLSAGIKSLGETDLVLLDTHDTIDALRELRSTHPMTTVIAVVNGKDFTADALAEGAWQCVRKPYDKRDLSMALANATSAAALKRELGRMRVARESAVVFGQSAVMRKLLAHVKRAAAKNAPVLIAGERGSGKLYAAESIHRMGDRWLSPFIPLNAGPGTSADEVFGDGGKASAARGGTLYVSGIDLMAEDIRKRLLAPLEGTDPDAVAGFRLIASLSTGSPAEGALATLFPTVIEMPPLRARREDIAPLAEGFAREAAQLFALPEKKISKDTAKLLAKHDWPGNVGELKGTIRRAVILAKDSAIEPCHISLDDGTAFCSIKDFLDAKLTRFIKDMVKLERTGLYDSVMGEAEKALISLVMAETSGNQVKASSVLGITRTTLRTKLKAYGLKE